MSGHYLNVVWELECNCLVLILYVSKNLQQSEEVLLINIEVRGLFNIMLFLEALHTQVQTRMTL